MRGVSGERRTEERSDIYITNWERENHMQTQITYRDRLIRQLDFLINEKKDYPLKNEYETIARLKSLQEIYAQVDFTAATLDVPHSFIEWMECNSITWSTMFINKECCFILIETGKTRLSDERSYEHYYLVAMEFDTVMESSISISPEELMTIDLTQYVPYDLLTMAPEDIYDTIVAARGE